MSDKQPLTLEEACEYIAGALSDPKTTKKWLFIIGAGISSPQIPLADVLATEYLNATGIDKPSDITVEKAGGLYYWLMETDEHLKARENQARYFKTLCERNPISLGNLSLARLIKTGKVADQVITTNFDDFLERALQLFDVEYRSSDCPETTDRTHTVFDCCRVYHVHGSYAYYDLCNTDQTIVERKQTLSPKLKDIIMESGGVLVLGYSAGKDDVVTDAIKQALSSGWKMENGSFWFCFQRQSAARLLQNHPKLFGEGRRLSLVAPDEQHSSSPTDGQLPATRVLARIAELTGANRANAPKLAFDEKPLTYLETLVNRAIGVGSNGKSLVLPDDDDEFGIAKSLEAVGRAKRTFEALLQQVRKIESADVPRLRELCDKGQFLAFKNVAKKISLNEVSPNFAKIALLVCDTLMSSVGLAGQTADICKEIMETSCNWAEKAFGSSTYKLLTKGERRQLTQHYAKSLLELGKASREGGGDRAEWTRAFKKLQTHGINLPLEAPLPWNYLWQTTLELLPSDERERLGEKQSAIGKTDCMNYWRELHSTKRDFRLVSKEELNAWITEWEPRE